MNRYRNRYSTDNIANVFYLESPVGVGFSYSSAADPTTDYQCTDDTSAVDAATVRCARLSPPTPTPRHPHATPRHPTPPHLTQPTPPHSHLLIVRNKNLAHTPVSGGGGAWR